MRSLEGAHGGVATEGTDQADAASLEQPLDLEGVATDVVLAQQVDVELAFGRRVIQTHHMLESFNARSYSDCCISVSIPPILVTNSLRSMAILLG